MADEQGKRIAKEMRYDRIFGHEEHMETAIMYHNLAVEAARNCRLTGQDGVIDRYRRSLQQFETSRRLLHEAHRDGLFSQTEAEDYNVRIYDTEMKLKAEMENAIRQGCSCAK